MTLTADSTTTQQDFDEDPLEYLNAEDRFFIDATFDSSVDPGRRTKAQLNAMPTFERLLYDRDRAAWHATLPLVRTGVVESVLEQLETIGIAASNHAMHQQGVPILNGSPGVGKSMIVRNYAADEMMRLAHLRAAEARIGLVNPRASRLRSSFRPVLFASLPAAMSRQELERYLCELLGWPASKDTSVSLSEALVRCETKLIIIDEIQFLGFHGATGRQVHNMIKGLTNQGVRVLLCGNDIEFVTGDRGAVEQESSRRQSRGRWITVDVPPMRYDSAAARAEWADVLQGYEDRLRLARRHAPGWLSRDLAAYTWVSSLGYMNSLATLIRNAAARAALTGTEFIDRAMLDKVHIEQEQQEGRMDRLSLLDRSKYSFTRRG